MTVLPFNSNHKPACPSHIAFIRPPAFSLLYLLPVPSENGLANRPSTSLSIICPAVYVQGHAGDIARFLARQIHGRIADVKRRSQP